MKREKKNLIIISLLLLTIFINTPVINLNYYDTSKETQGNEKFINLLRTAGLDNISVISDAFIITDNHWNDGSSTFPEIAIDGNNTIHVVWDDWTAGVWGNDREIMYANYSTQTGWSDAIVISDGYQGSYWNDGSSHKPRIAVDKNNSVHVVWRDETNGAWGFDSEIMYVNYSTQAGWSNATVISDGYQGAYWNDGISIAPDIAIDSNNTIHVVWEDGTEGAWGDDDEIIYVNYSTQTGWSNITVISDGFAGSYWNDGGSYDPAITVDGNDTVHIVWWDETEGIWGAGLEIMYANISTQTGLTNVTVISDGYQGSYWNNDDSDSVDIRVDGNNTIHVIWQDSNNGEWGDDTEIMCVNYTSQEGWSNITVVSDGFAGSYLNDGLSGDPSIIVDSYNIIHAVWQEGTDGEWGEDDEIMYANYSTQTGWSNITVISDGFEGSYWNDGNSYSPSIMMDEDMALHVVWHDETDGLWGEDKEIMYVNYSTQTGWSNATVISDGRIEITDNYGQSEFSEIAIDDNNIIHVVWEDSSNGIWGTDREIMYAKYSTQIGWSNITIISDGYNARFWNDGQSSNPKIAIDGNNHIHVVWSDYTDGVWGTDIEIMYVNYTDTNGWSNVSVISDGFEGDYWNNRTSINPSIVIDGNNTVHVVWEDDTYGVWGVDTEIMYVNRTATGSWSNATVISDGFEGSYWNNDDSEIPTIAVDSSNTLHVVWEDASNGEWTYNALDTEIFYVNYTAINGWSNVSVISDGYQGSHWNNGPSNRPSIATDENNNAHVVWDDFHGGGVSKTQIWYVNYSPQNGWSNGTMISDGFEGSYWNNDFSYEPVVAIDSDNVIHVVWKDYTNGVWGDDNEIMYVNYTTSNGWTNATCISDGFAGSYWNDEDSDNPAIAVDGNNKVHIIWDDDTNGDWGTYTDVMYVSLSWDTETENGGNPQPPESPPDSPIILILLIVVIGSVIGVVSGVVISKKKKGDGQRVEIAAPKKGVKKIKGKKGKTIESEEKSPVLTQAEIAELQKTEEEVDVERQKFICVVHKGPIEADNLYLCPKCHTLYCLKCATILKEKGEHCWSCETNIQLKTETPSAATPAVESNIDEKALELQAQIKKFDVYIQQAEAMVQKLDIKFGAGAISTEEYNEKKNMLAEKIGAAMAKRDKLKEN